MTATLLPNAKNQFLDGNGKPLAGGSVYFYIPNTSAKKDTYQDAAQTILNTNPIILDASGEAVIWGTGTYRQVVFDQYGNLIWDQITSDVTGGLLGDMVDDVFIAGTDFTPGTTTVLNLTAAPGSIPNTWIYFDAAYQDDAQATVAGKVLTFTSPIPVGVGKVTVKIGSTVAIGTPGDGTVTDATVAAGAAINSSKLSYNQGAPGAITRTVRSRLQDFASLKDFGVKGDGVTDDTAAIQSAMNSGARYLYVPAPTVSYMTTAPITITSALTIVGDGTTPYQNTGPFPGNRGPGSWFYINHAGVGFAIGDAAGSTFLTGVNISSIGTYRNHTNAIQTGWTPNVFDFDFKIYNTSFLLDDICMLNAYNGISVPNNYGTRGTLRNVYGQWFNIGINISNAQDSIRLEDIHHWPFWANQAPVTSYQLANTVVVSLARADDPVINNLFSIYANQVIACFQNASGKTSRLQATNITADQCNYPLFVDPGVTGFTGQFTNFSSYGPSTPSASGMGVLIDGASCQVDFVNLQGTLMSNSFLTVGGSNNYIRVNNLECDGWGAFGNTAPMINLFAGGGGNQVHVSERMITTGAIGPYGTIVVSAPPGTVFANPQGVQTGTASIGSGATSVVVNHNLPIAPTQTQISIGLLSSIGAAQSIFVDGSSITSTNFTIRTSAAPGGSGIAVAWRAALE